MGTKTWKTRHTYISKVVLTCDHDQNSADGIGSTIEGNYCIDLIMNWLAVKTCDEWVVAAAGLVVGVIGFVCTIISFCFLLVVGVIG